MSLIADAVTTIMANAAPIVFLDSCGLPRSYCKP